MLSIRHVFETNSSSAHGGFVKSRDEWVDQGPIKGYQHLGNFARVEGENHNILHLGSYELPDLEFGWGYQLLAHPVQKIAYAIASLLGGEMDDTGTGDHLHPLVKGKWDEIVEAVHSYWPQIDTIKIPESSYYGGAERRVDKYLLDDGSFMYYDAEDRDHRQIGSPIYPRMGEKSPKIIERVEDNIYIHVYEYGFVDHESIGMLTGFLKVQKISLRELFFNGKYVLYTDNDNTPIISDLIQHGIISSGFSRLVSIY